MIMRSAIMEVLRLAIDGILYRDATTEETAQELQRWEMAR